MELNVLKCKLLINLDEIWQRWNCGSRSENLHNLSRHPLFLNKIQHSSQIKTKFIRGFKFQFGIWPSLTLLCRLCVCVCVRARERERESIIYIHVYIYDNEVELRWNENKKKKKKAINVGGWSISFSNWWHNEKLMKPLKRQFCQPSLSLSHSIHL